MKVLSSEAYSKHGYKPSCVIFDELHAQPNRDLWDIMTFGAGDAREQPVWIVLTTAGDDPDRKSIGWEVHEKALSILRCRNGCAREGDMDDPRWLPIVYGLGLIEDEDELKAINIYDEDLWRRCNPSIGKTVKLSTIRAEAQEAKRSEAAERLFRWLRLNQWIATHTVGWIPVTIYDKTQWNPEGCKDWREAVNLLRGKKCFGGGDLSKSTDLTAFTLLFPPQDGLDMVTVQCIDEVGDRYETQTARLYGVTDTLTAAFLQRGALHCGDRKLTADRVDVSRDLDVADVTIVVTFEDDRPTAPITQPLVTDVTLGAQPTNQKEG